MNRRAAATPAWSEPTAGYFSRDPVRWAQVLASFIGAVITVLLASAAIPQRTAAIVTGVATAILGAVQELYVRPSTVPRAPLQDLARAMAARGSVTRPPDLGNDAGKQPQGDPPPS